MEVVRKSLNAKKTAVHMAIEESDLNKAIRDNKFKNSIETGKGSFKTIGDDRLPVEKDVFGLADDVAERVDEMPKYGYIAGAKEMDYPEIVGKNYGTNYVRFDPSIRERSTLTMADSLSGNSHARAAPASAINDPQMSSLLRLIEVDDTGRYVIGDKEGVRIFVQSGDYIDLVKAAKAPYLEAQMFGRVTLDDVVVIEVESKKYAAKLQRALKKAGKDNIEVKGSTYHTRFKAMADGHLDSYHSFNAVDIDALGAGYIDNILQSYAGGVLHKKAPGKSFGWFDDQLPESLNKFRGTVDGLKDAMSKWSLAEKRAYLKEFYRLMAEGKEGGLPKIFWSEYRKTQAGFTQDVFNEKLLDAYK